MRVKICGIKTLEAAQAASEAGADFLGFNFVRTSKRFISPGIAKNIIKKLPLLIAKVGVFMDTKFEEVNKLISYLNLDYVQLHGNESPSYINLIKNTKIIKTFSLPSDFDVEETIKKMKQYKVDYFLLDRKEQGTGELLSPTKVKEITSVFPIILAGGLTVENVEEVIRITKPQVVDVAGGVEVDGKKDRIKIKEFIRRARHYG